MSFLKVIQDCFIVQREHYGNTLRERNPTRQRIVGSARTFSCCPHKIKLGLQLELELVLLGFCVIKNLSFQIFLVSFWLAVQCWHELVVYLTFTWCRHRSVEQNYRAIGNAVSRFHETTAADCSQLCRESPEVHRISSWEAVSRRVVSAR